MKLNEQVCTIPTIGFNVETVTPVKGVTFTVWDIGGQEKIRSLWRHYYDNTQVSEMMHSSTTWEFIADYFGSHFSPFLLLRKNEGKGKKKLVKNWSGHN